MSIIMIIPADAERTERIILAEKSVAKDVRRDAKSAARKDAKRETKDALTNAAEMIGVTEIAQETLPGRIFPVLTVMIPVTVTKHAVVKKNSKTISMKKVRRFCGLFVVKLVRHNFLPKAVIQLVAFLT